MRRFLPHIILLLTGAICLVVIWSLEPPIAELSRVQKQQRADQRRPIHYRLVAKQPLDAARLVVKIGYDETKLADPRVRRSLLSRGNPPKAAMETGQIMVTFEKTRHQPGKDSFGGPGRLARLSFAKTAKGEIIDLGAVWIEGAVAFAADGTEKPVVGLKLNRYQPHHRRAASTRGKQRETAL